MVNNWRWGELWNGVVNGGRSCCYVTNREPGICSARFSQCGSRSPLPLGRGDRGEAPVNWSQNYDPLRNVFLSTAVAALPLVALLGLLASGRVKAHLAAVVGL